MTLEERILLNEIKKQNKDVFDALFKQYYPLLVKFSEAYLHDLHACEDIVQSFFVSLWTNSEKVNIQDSLKGYFFKSVKNLCLNRLRTLQIEDKHHLQYIESLINIDSDASGSDTEIVKLLNDAIQELPSQMAEVFRQKYYHGKQVKEIAQGLGITEGTVKTQLFRARKTLRETLRQSTSLNFFL